MKFKWFRRIALKLLAPHKKPKNFPDWIVKTDETRLQNMPFVLEQYKNVPMIVTEKLDGTSTSFGLKREKKRKYDFAVCSRNVRQEDINQKCFYDDNVYHIIAQKYDMKSVLIKILTEYNATTVVLQGEAIGEAIQKNKYGLQGIDFYAFNLVIDGKRIDSSEATDIVHKFGISIVDKTNPDFAFLEKRNYKIKTMKMKGVLSQGIVFPLSVLPKKEWSIGLDVTSLLKITEIEDELPKQKPENALT